MTKIRSNRFFLLLILLGYGWMNVWRVWTIFRYQETLVSYQTTLHPLLQMGLFGIFIPLFFWIAWLTWKKSPSVWWIGLLVWGGYTAVFLFLPTPIFPQLFIHLLLAGWFTWKWRFFTHP